MIKRMLRIGRSRCRFCGTYHSGPCPLPIGS